MPITPFHFGPGAAFHALSPRHVSFLAFCAANVIMDVEPLYYIVTNQFPLHRFFHTYVGASIVLVATLALFLGAFKLASLVPLPNVFSWKQLTVRQVAIGAALGSYSHIVLDSLMHADIQPFWPFSESNPLLRAVSLGTLHWACLAAGITGLVILGIRKVLREEAGL
jgi:membrane-bound metal-dependent hydrolase YbcI (DUF457 family)